MPRYDVTVRHGRGTWRYHTFQVEATDLARALRDAAAELPDEVREAADLVELRRAPDPAERAYVDG